MTSIDIPEVSTEYFSAWASFDGECLELCFAGDADIDAVSAVDGVLRKAEEVALRVAAKRVAVDFHELEFMNSSCFKCFVTWLRRVQGMDGSKRYKIRFLSDPGKHWQRRSLEAIRCFAADLVDIEA